MISQRDPHTSAKLISPHDSSMDPKSQSPRDEQRAPKSQPLQRAPKSQPPTRSPIEPQQLLMIPDAFSQMPEQRSSTLSQHSMLSQLVSQISETDPQTSSSELSCPREPVTR